MHALARRAVGLAGWRRLVVASAVGTATAAAQPPLSAPAILFLALPLLLWLLDGATRARTGFAIGWCAGAGHFAAALFWIVEPFLVEPEVFGWMAPFALAGMAFGLALFWAVPFALTVVLTRPGLLRVLALAALVVSGEIVRSRVLTGFPWGLTGYAWVETPVIQTVALFGPYMLGLLTLVAALLPGLVTGRAVAAAAALVAVGWGYGAVRLAQPLPEVADPLVVRLVQPNAAQHLKWQPGMAQEFYERHLRLSRAEPRPDVTIWSETAVPFLLESRPDLLAEAAAAAAPGRLILGIQRAEIERGEPRWYNGLAVLEPDGRVAAVYDKHHLVPFGEYIPWASLVARLGLPGLETLTGGGFSPGPGPRRIAVDGLPAFLPLICYEAIFPNGLAPPEGRPEWLVQLTNDAWFGQLAGPFQHLAQARIRAIEQGLPLARSANTGISAMVDPYGRILAQLELGEVGSIDSPLPGALPVTPYAAAGETITFFTIGGILLLTVLNFMRGVPRGAS
jgi:apolipoprotein N-acyltransferase